MLKIRRKKLPFGLNHKQNPVFLYPEKDNDYFLSYSARSPSWGTYK